MSLPLYKFKISSNGGNRTEYNVNEKVAFLTGHYSASSYSKCPKESDAFILGMLCQVVDKVNKVSDRFEELEEMNKKLMQKMDNVDNNLKAILERVDFIPSDGATEYDLCKANFEKNKKIN